LSALILRALASTVLENKMQKGMLNQNAPELRVPYWFDGKGLEIEPLKLADLRLSIIGMGFIDRRCGSPC